MVADIGPSLESRQQHVHTFGLPISGSCLPGACGGLVTAGVGLAATAGCCTSGGGAGTENSSSGIASRPAHMYRLTIETHSSFPS